MPPQYLMGPSIRRLLIVVVLLSPGYLALPATAGTEPETVSAWTGEPGAEPAAVAPIEDAGLASLPQPSVSADAPLPLDGDLWAEFFTTPAPPEAKTEPARPVGSASASPRPSKPAGIVAGSYQIQQNDTVQRFLDQFQTGYRRAVVERWLTRSGRFLPMILESSGRRGCRRSWSSPR